MFVDRVCLRCGGSQGRQNQHGPTRGSPHTCPGQSAAPASPAQLPSHLRYHDYFIRDITPNRIIVSNTKVINDTIMTCATLIGKLLYITSLTTDDGIRKKMVNGDSVGLVP